MDIGGSQGRHYKPSIDFFKKIGDQYADGNYKSMVPVGHSLSGSIGVRVAYEFNTELTVVYNPAALKVGGWAQDIVLKSRAAQLLREHIKKHNPERLPTFMPNSMTDEEKAILDREYQKLKRQADEQQKYIAEKEKHFTGRIVRIHAQSDGLTLGMFASGGVYSTKSEEYILMDAGTHGLERMLESDHQRRINDIIAKAPEEMEKQVITKGLRDYLSGIYSAMIFGEYILQTIKPITNEIAETWEALFPPEIARAKVDFKFWWNNQSEATRKTLIDNVRMLLGGIIGAEATNSLFNLQEHIMKMLEQKQNSN